MKRLIFILLAFLPLFMPSCTDADGDWDPMKWRLADSNNELKSLIFEVPAEGADYDFYCKNYSGYWIEGIRVNDTYIAVDTEYGDSNMKTQWSHVTVDGHNMHVTINENTSGEEQTIVVIISGGDVFSSLQFNQAADE